MVGWEKVVDVACAHLRDLLMPIVWVLRGAEWETEIVTQKGRGTY